MVGIVAFGVYVPYYRLDWSLLARAWGKGSAQGRRSVTNYDEDSITMAVTAGIDCLSGRDRDAVGRLNFASTTSPYHEKQSGALVASAIDLRRDILTMDFGNSLRCGTNALLAAVDAVRSGAEHQVLVTAADCRMGLPSSDQERTFGDGAAALLIGDHDVVAEIESCYSISDEILDLWRSDTEMYVRAWEDRFVISEGFLRNLQEATSGLMTKCGGSVGQFAKVIYNAPDRRTHLQSATVLGVDVKNQVEDSLVGTIGNTGGAYALMLLSAALESASAGDRILLLNYGDGCDAISMRVAEDVVKIRDRKNQGLKRFLNACTPIASYEKYLSFRSAMQVEPPRRPSLPTSPARLWREREEIYRFHAFRCKRCGTVMFPKPAKIRVCLNCQSIDQMERVKASNLNGTVFSFVVDHLYASVDPPTVTALIDFEGGGRLYCSMADRDVEKIKVGANVRMVFRKIIDISGVHNYYWKFKLRD